MTNITFQSRELCIIYIYAIDWSVVVLCPDICHPLLRLTACWPPHPEHPGDHCRSRPRINQPESRINLNNRQFVFTLCCSFSISSSFYT